MVEQIPSDAVQTSIATTEISEVVEEAKLLVPTPDQESLVLVPATPATESTEVSESSAAPIKCKP